VVDLHVPDSPCVRVDGAGLRSISQQGETLVLAVRDVGIGAVNLRAVVFCVRHSVSR